MRRMVAAAGLGIGIAGLLLQFAVSVPPYLDEGLSLPAAIIRFFSFFTVLAHILLVLVYLGAMVKGHAWLKLFRRPVTRATAAAVIALVMGYYHLLLSDRWEPQGWVFVSDVTLHYVTPMLYLIWFAVWNRSGTLRYGAIPFMLLAPSGYFVLIMVRGALMGEYPYGILNATQVGYGQVAINFILLAAVLAVLSAAAIAVDRALILSKAK